MEHGVSDEALVYVEARLSELVETEKLDAEIEQIIRLRYGIGDNKPLNFKQLTKVFKLPPKKMKLRLLQAERTVFNILKKNI